MLGGNEFQTGTCIFGDSVTTKIQALNRNYQRFFRRLGVEWDLELRVIDTPPLMPRPQDLHKLCPDGVHVIVLTVRADLCHENLHLEQDVEVLKHTQINCC